jgi:hypothetical protein
MRQHSFPEGLAGPHPVAAAGHVPGPGHGEGLSPVLCDDECDDVYSV